MADRKIMHPPGSPQHGVAIIIAAHPADGPGGKGKMPPPGMSMSDDTDAPPIPGDDATDPQKDADGKVSPEAAQVIREDQKCGDCQNYDATSGMCSKVSGSFSPDDGCLLYFAPMTEDDDADDQNAPPDADANDQGASPDAPPQTQ